jgi:hypothetical protein
MRYHRNRCTQYNSATECVPASHTCTRPVESTACWMVSHEFHSPRTRLLPTTQKKHAVRSRRSRPTRRRIHSIGQRTPGVHVDVSTPCLSCVRSNPTAAAVTPLPSICFDRGGRAAVSDAAVDGRRWWSVRCDAPSSTSTTRCGWSRDDDDASDGCAVSSRADGRSRQRRGGSCEQDDRSHRVSTHRTNRSSMTGSTIGLHAPIAPPLASPVVDDRRSTHTTAACSPVAHHTPHACLPHSPVLCRPAVTALSLPPSLARRAASSRTEARDDGAAEAVTTTTSGVYHRLQQSTFASARAHRRLHIRHRRRHPHQHIS